MAQVIYDGIPEDFEHLAESGYEFRTRDYIYRGWDIFQQYAGGFIGFFLLAMLMVSVSAVIPVVGTIAAVGLQYCAFAGIMIVARKISNGEAYTFNDFFSGFDHFKQLLVGGLLVYVFTTVGTLFFVIPGIYLGVAYTMVIPLVVFGRLEAWPAMETSRRVVSANWWAFFKLFLVLVVGIILVSAIVGGVIGGLFVSENAVAMVLGGGLTAGLVLGLVAIMPAFYCIYYAIYEDIFDYDYEEEMTHHVMDEDYLDDPIE